MNAGWSAEHWLSFPLRVKRVLVTSGLRLVRNQVLKALAGLLLLLGTAKPAAADLILSNGVDAPYLENGTIFEDQSSLKGVGVGIPLGSDYFFDTFRVVLQGLTGSPQATGRIFSSDGTDTPVAELQTLNTVVVVPGHAMYDFISPVQLILESEKSYWFVISDGPAIGDFRWDRTDPVGIPTGIADFLGCTFSEDSGTHWRSSDVFNAFELNATVVPEPTTLSLLALGGLSLMRRRR